MKTTNLAPILLSLLSTTACLAPDASDDASDPRAIDGDELAETEAIEDAIARGLLEAPGIHDARELPALPAQVTTRYVVRLRDGVTDVIGEANRLSKKHGGVRRHVFGSTIKGFTVVNLSEAKLAELRADPNVISVEPDVRIKAAFASQANPGWGLDRMDQANGLNLAYQSYREGTGVHIYVVDSGIRGDHAEFSGRLTSTNNVNTYDTSSPNTDSDGHGTAVASYAAGATTGTARKATIHSVKITNGDWAWESDLIAGVDWVTANAQKPAVLNLSYDGSTDAIASALQAAIQKRIVVVKAAGNEHESACTDESNEVAGVIVVGATDNADNRSSFSDYGPCLSLFAPGVGVRGASIAGPNSFMSGNGTSFSAPYVAGIAAMMLEQRPLLTSHQVEAFLAQTAWAGKVQDWAANSPNLLANVRFFSASQSGPTDIYSGLPGIDDPTSYTWTASTLGGWGAQTYKWERSINGGPYSVVGTASTLTLTIQPGTKQVMSLRVTVTSDGRTAIANKVVDIKPEEVCVKYNVCY
ncbi:MAG: S8 family serine peptidase [Kofleriaceae bacterium]|nr:S8 family serine peptidase [Kofleriaceae bacterium]